MNIIAEAGATFAGTEATKAALLTEISKEFPPMSGGLEQGNYNVTVSSNDEYFGFRLWEKGGRKGSIICLACVAIDDKGKEHSFGLPTEKARTLAIMKEHLLAVKQGSRATMVINEKGYISSFKVEGSTTSTTSSEQTTALNEISEEAINKMNKAQLVALAKANNVQHEPNANAVTLKALLIGELV